MSQQKSRQLTGFLAAPLSSSLFAKLNCAVYVLALHTSSRTMTRALSPVGGRLYLAASAAPDNLLTHQGMSATDSSGSSGPVTASHESR